MLNYFNNLPQGLRYSLLAVAFIFLGASGREFINIFTDSKPKLTKVPIIIKSESTSKPLSDAEIKILVNGAPIILKTDSNGYAETEIAEKEMINVEVNKVGYLSKSEILNLSRKPDQPFRILLPIDPQAVSCFGDSCTGRIPGAAKCSVDVTTLNYATGEKFIRKNVDNVIRIEMRSSQQCNAIWAKAVAPAGSLMYLQDDQGSKLIHYNIPDDDLSDHHTEMVSRDLRVRACVQNVQGDKKTTCTGFIN